MEHDLQNLQVTIFKFMVPWVLAKVHRCVMTIAVKAEGRFLFVTLKENLCTSALCSLKALPCHAGGLASAPPAGAPPPCPHVARVQGGHCPLDFQQMSH